MKKIVLASNSPRRKELLQGLGIPFDVLVLQGIDESYPADLPAAEVAEYISRKKASAYLQSSMVNQEEAVILTADTIVVCDGDILGKPHSEEEAVSMLQKLSGKTHQVYTGYCLTPLSSSPGQTLGSRQGQELSSLGQHSGTVCTDVTFKVLSEEEILHYVRNFKPFDKAGAYGIQEWIGYIGITGIKGSYYNVMGLPVQRIYEELRKMGFTGN